MTTARPDMSPVASVAPPSAHSAGIRRRGHHWRGGNSVLAHSEPMMWLTGGGLVICLLMIIGLLLLVIYQGLATFWPLPLLQVRTLDDRVYLGEVTRSSTFSLDYNVLATTTGPIQESAARILHPLLAARARSWSADPRRLAEVQGGALQVLTREVEALPAVRQAPAEMRRQLLEQMGAAWRGQAAAYTQRFSEDLRRKSAADPQGQQLYDWWGESQVQYENWLASTELSQLAAPWKELGPTTYSLWVRGLLHLLSAEVSVPMTRRLLRTGNFELTNEHFTWISDFEIAPRGATRPEWAFVLERLAWGRFYGQPKALLVDDQPIANEPADVWRAFLEHHTAVRERWSDRRALERDDIGEINYRLESERLRLRQLAMDHGEPSEVFRRAEARFAENSRRAEEEFARVRDRIAELDRENERYQLQMVTADGQEKNIALADIVQAYPANRLSQRAALGVYLARWAEFLTDEPREANSEGGVLPAIFGTVVMTLLMCVAVVPFGVLASLYLREYARAGIMVTIVRIAVNNLAGVPSIVFGVFGLGFFCYIMGGTIDQLFFQAKLPSPTFGTGGLLWGSLTLALLTLPVVIVATEEALSAVPNSLREGSYACGASKWQTIRRIVLPHALPGIMTGMILAMARGAGEVAPLMLVGAVKLAPELPINGYYPFVHFSRSFMHLGFHIYDLGFQSQNSEAAKPMVFTTTLLLIAIIAFLNVAAVALRARLRRRLHVGRF